ncbi:lactate utilization protein [Brucepastera parasyntrophica]|uniref:lactate utilization protein n=1 Tax=Brucepastera parasyntrophica TaxID=2880008 RepID=UPI00210954BC|nr:lactate utilization protein [Brucepastera parasyntrophica]ULQ59775.1 lactate utilization protein [Brucepastera parasyntrophica]
MLNITEKTIRALKQNRIPARYMETAQELFSCMDSCIASKDMVGTGDSETLNALGVYTYLRNRDIFFLDKYGNNVSKDDKRNIYLNNFKTDVFISGINALTAEGKIFNLDGNGSRVAPIIYGPKKVLLICGTNKLVYTDAEAYERIRSRAAPLDAIRLGKNTPCAKTGYCVDCKSADKICNYYSIIQGQFDKDRINVLIINGEYGY